MVAEFCCDDHHLAFQAPGKHNNTELEMPPKGKGKTCTNRKFGGFISIFGGVAFFLLRQLDASGLKGM